MRYIFASRSIEILLNLGYETLGLKLVEQLSSGVDDFCAADGTAKMAIGVAKMLKEKNLETRIVVLEPSH